MNRKDPELGRYFNLSKPYPLTKMEGGDEVVDEDKLKIKRSAYDELLMSMSNATNDGKTAFHIVTYTKDKDGEGDAREGFRKLLERYEPKTSLEKRKLMKKFYSASCRYKEDPVQYVYNMEVLKDRIHTIENGKEIISPEDFLHQILNSLPSQYNGLSEQLQ